MRLSRARSSNKVHTQSLRENPRYQSKSVRDAATVISKNKLYIHQRDSASPVILRNSRSSWNHSSQSLGRVTWIIVLLTSLKTVEKRWFLEYHRPCGKAIYEYFFGSTIYSAQADVFICGSTVAPSMLADERRIACWYRTVNFCLCYWFTLERFNLSLCLLNLFLRQL